MYCILVIGPRVTVIRPKLNLVPALGIVGLFNVRSGTFHCLSIHSEADRHILFAMCTENNPGCPSVCHGGKLYSPWCSNYDIKVFEV